MKKGDRSSITRTFTKDDVVRFSGFSKDSNPIHFNEEYASKTVFRKCIVQGPMVSSLIGGILGSTLPGNGTIYLSQNSKFLKPVFINDTVTAHVEVTHIRTDKPIITLRTWVTNQEDECVLDGEAIILLMNNNSRE
jgi:3-hydroxybutyryl-CoA dehydratase